MGVFLPAWERGNLMPTLMRFLIVSTILAALAGYFVVESVRQQIEARPEAGPQTADTSAAFVPLIAPSASEVPAVPTETITASEPQTNSLQPPPPTHFKPSASAAPVGLAESAQTTVMATQEPRTAQEPSGRPVSRSGRQASVEPAEARSLHAEAEARDSSSSNCLPSAAAVRQAHPGAWPLWTLRAPGHSGTRCWFAGTRGGHHRE
jgi:hypothetical protein